MTRREPGVDGRLLPTAVAAWFASWWLTGHPMRASFIACLAAIALTSALLISVFALAARPNLSQLALVAAVVTVIAIVVFAQHQQTAALAALAQSQRTIRLTGRVASEPRPAPFGSGSQWTLRVQYGQVDSVAAQLAGTVRLTTAERPAYRAQVTVKTKLRAARPGELATARGNGTELRVRKPPALPIRWTTRSRADLITATSVLSPQGAGLVQGMAIGETSALPKELAGDFKTAGLTHLTAVSGGHFSIVLTLANAMTVRLRAGKPVRVGLIGALAAMFVLLVRPDPSVLRAAAMCAVGMLAIASGRKQSTIPSLAASSIVLLVVDPTLSRSYGFALSCAATLGLALLTSPLTDRLAPWLGRPVAFAIAVPLAAQLCCAPILALFSDGLPTVSVLANVLAAPAVAPATMLGLAAAATAPSSIRLAQGLAKVAALATGWIALVAHWCAGLPFATIAMPWAPTAGLRAALSTALLSALVLVAVLCRPPGAGWPLRVTEYPARTYSRVRSGLQAALQRYRANQPTARDRYLLLGSAAIALLLLLAISMKATIARRQHNASRPADWQVAACDVGQGDALAVRTGQHSAMVIDVGPDRQVIDHCLTDLGITEIDLLVLTHAHADHIDGLPGAVAGRKVTEVLAPFDPHLSTPRSDSTAGLLGTGEWSVQWELLNPTPRFGDDLNNNSYALAINASGPSGVIRIVDLADLEDIGQDQLLSELPNAELPTQHVDLLKVAHHGSAAQSQSLANWLAPRLAVVSSGIGNSYGHPTDRMLDLYEGIGSKIVRTDQCGTAMFARRSQELATFCTG